MSDRQEDQTAPHSRHWSGRLWVLGAAVLWSTSGLFAQAPIFDDWPADARGPLLAFWRALFAGVMLLPLARRFRWRWGLLPLAGTFAAMNLCFVTALTTTTAANAIWLQYTAPFWVFLLGYLLWRDPVVRSDVPPLVCAGLGVGLIVAMELFAPAAGQTAGRAAPQMAGVAWGLASGLFYAGVVLGMRRMSDEDPAALVAFCHLASAAVLLPYVITQPVWPSVGQFATLAGFGLLQMGLPYMMFVTGLRAVSSQEASLITLVEPILVPLWVWLAWSLMPAWWTIAGGAVILAGLIVRYSRTPA